MVQGGSDIDEQYEAQATSNSRYINSLLEIS